MYLGYIIRYGLGTDRHVSLKEGQRRLSCLEAHLEDFMWNLRQ